MKKILFGLLLYCFTTFAAQAVFYLAWHHDAAETTPDFFNGLDTASLLHGENPQFSPVVLLLGEGEHGTGLLIEPPAGYESLQGRLLLTAAHVILKNKGKGIIVHPTGLAATADSEDSLDGGELIETTEIIPHEGFRMDDEGARQFDYGLIILSKSITGVRLNLPEPGSIDLDSVLGSPIEIVGFGNRLDAGGSVVPGRITDGGFKKRAFDSTIREREGKILALNSKTFLATQPKKVLTFPFSGDSGGAVFVKGDPKLLGIVSGIEPGEEVFKYIHVTSEDVSGLLASKK